MGKIGKLYTYSEFIQERHIEIPRIQRDYTYGSNTRKTNEVVDHLLSDIYDALFNGGSEIILDFVYGSTNKRKMFEPLDGQQRLTTLYLLDLYANWATKHPIENRFNYSTRDNTTIFCKSITDPEFKYDPNCPIKEQIIDCAFYLPSFNDDPSIKSMLVVLERIEEKFKEKALSGELYQKLHNNCPVKFFALDFDKFDLSDDLYIKMNSRGKPLTEYEIFKAQIEKYIEKTLGDKELMYRFAKSFDTDFTDLVWNELGGTSNDLQKIDNGFIHLINNVLALIHFKRKERDIAFKSDDELKNIWDNLEINTDDVEFILDFMNTFNVCHTKNLIDGSQLTGNDVFWEQLFYKTEKAAFGDENIEKASEEDRGISTYKIRTFKTSVNIFKDACNKSLTYAELVMLYAMYYCAKYKPANWELNMRHVRNLIENSDDEITRPKAICPILKDIETILNNDILTLESTNLNSTQFSEEQFKAKSPERWKELYKYENHDILRGTLSLFAGADANDIFNISDDSIFSRVLKRLKTFSHVFTNDLYDYDSNVTKDKKDHTIRATLLSYGNFCQSVATDKTCSILGRNNNSWRIFFSKNKFYKQNNIIEVLDKIDTTKPFAVQPVSPDDWRYYAVTYKDNIYVAYNSPVYGYFRFLDDNKHPSNLILLQSKAWGDDNIQKKMLNNILYDRFAWGGIIPDDLTGKFYIGRKVDALALVISNHIYFDARENGWYIHDFDNPDCNNWLQTTYSNYDINTNILQLNDSDDFIAVATDVIHAMINNNFIK